MWFVEAGGRARPGVLEGRECDYRMHRMNDGGDVKGACIVTQALNSGCGRES